MCQRGVAAAGARGSSTNSGAGAAGYRDFASRERQRWKEDCATLSC